MKCHCHKINFPLSFHRRHSNTSTMRTSLSIFISVIAVMATGGDARLALRGENNDAGSDGAASDWDWKINDANNCYVGEYRIP